MASLKSLRFCDSDNSKRCVKNKNISSVLEKMCVIVLLVFCLELNSFVHGINSVNSDISNQDTKLTLNHRESKKLFGGYRITPKFCKPTKNLDIKAGPNICMFNGECAQRNGQVVGACMDGFLFGTCCQLPADSTSKPLETLQLPDAALSPENTISLKEDEPKPQINNDIIPNEPTLIHTSEENAIVQVESVSFHPNSSPQTIIPQFAETVLYHSNGSEVENQINSDDFVRATEKSSTSRVEQSTKPFYYHSSPKFTTKFKPDYVLVPTITKTNNTPEIDSIANILQMLDDKAPPKIIDKAETKSTTTPISVTPTKYAPSTIYLFTSTPGQYTVNSTPKPPSTSYVFSTTLSPRPGSKPGQLYTTPQYSSSPQQPSSSYTPSPYSQFPTSGLPTPTVILLGGPSSTPKPLTSSESSLSSLSPTVLITPKPNIASTSTYWTQTQTPSIIVKNPSTESSNLIVTGSTGSPGSIGSTIQNPGFSQTDDLTNFPPVRNPNLNMSQMSTTADGDFEITTPVFLEDDALNEKVEVFVNKIIQSLQEPFDDLRTVVYSNKSSTTTTTTTTTKKPPKKTTVTTKKPPLKASTVITTKKPTTPKKPTKKVTPALTTRRPATTILTTKKTKPTKRVTTTTTVSSSSEESSSSSEEDEDEDEEEVQQVPDYKRQCGVRPLMRSGKIVGGKGATFGEWPWQVLVKESTWLGLFTKNKCGGVLISSRYVITAAHCQPGFLASLVAVFGEFDISGELESKRSVVRPVKRVIVHREYKANTFENDLALLELETPVTFDTHIVPICLPPDEEDFTGRMATVTGWGRLKYGGGVPSVLQEVQVPIMENSVCQEMFETAGHTKVILESFLCAGYANGQKDSCEGDSGGPLVLQRSDGRWELAGTVSHGIKCAAPYLPGVYMRTTFFKPWLSTITGVH